MKRIRIVLLTGSLNIGGTERNVLHLACALDRRRYAVKVWCIYGGHPLQRELERRGIPCRTFKTPSSGGRLSRILRSNLPFQWRLGRALRRARPDILHAFGFPTAYYAVLLGRLAGVRRVVFAVQDWDVWKGRSRVYRWLDALCSRLAAAVIADGAGARRLAVEKQGMPPNTVRVIYDGVNTEELRPLRPREAVRAELGLDAARPVAAVIARLDAKKKGQDLFIAAVPHALRLAPDLQFLLVGGGPDEALLREQAAGLPEGRRPVFAGFRADLADILNATDILVIPSRWESVPKVLLEAMWLRRAIVAARVGDIAEVLDPACGELVAPDAPRDLGEAVGRLARDAALRQRLGKEAHRRLVERGLTLGASVARYDRLYQALAGRRVGNRPMS